MCHSGQGHRDSLRGGPGADPEGILHQPTYRMEARDVKELSFKAADDQEPWRFRVEAKDGSQATDGSDI